MRKEIFISHSAQDRELAMSLCAMLENQGVSCWIAPRDVPITEKWDKEIVSAISNAAVFLLVLTPASNFSRYVCAEVHHAFSCEKKFLIFRTEEIIPSDDLTLYLSRQQWADGFPPPLEERASRMGDQLLSLLGRKPLQFPVERSTISSPPSTPAAGGPIFDQGGRLRLEAFTFSVGPVLLRAAKRRRLQKRLQATPTDVLAGLIRVGPLTRLVFEKAGVDADALYGKLEGIQEEGERDECASFEFKGSDADSPLDPEKMSELLMRWILRKREDFTEELVAILEKAAAANAGSLSEQAVLEALVEAPFWSNAGVALPTPADVRSILAARSRAAVVDENGEVPMDDLTPGAREVMKLSHLLARQCQSAQITHRLLLASFINESEYFAAKLCRKAGVDPEFLWALLVILSRDGDDSGKEKSSRVSGLTPEVCARCITPTLMKARAMAGRAQVITEEQLFRAFCDTAEPAFVEFLRAKTKNEELEITELDLAELGSLHPDKPDLLDGLTFRARRVVRRAHEFAERCGVKTIPNRLLLAAFLADDDGLAHHLLKKQRIPAAQVVEILITSAKFGGKEAISFSLDEASAARIVTPTIEQARILAGAESFITERLLLRAFCEKVNSDMKAQLKSKGLDLDALGADAHYGVGIRPPASERPSPNPLDDGRLFGPN